MIEVNKIHEGNCLEVLKTFPDNSIDSCVTDPPYGISFMNKHWDYQVPSVEVWNEILRVLKPGGYLLCACGTRTQHRMAVNIEDAGFEIRDVITWVYGSGFPKSMDISKAIYKQSGVNRTEIPVGNPVKRMIPGADQNNTGSWIKDNGKVYQPVISSPASDKAKEWEGWGTALKPACEFWTLARKPISENTVADNVLKFGTGGINIDECRIEFVSDKDFDSATFGRGTNIIGGNYVGATHGNVKTNIEANRKGRFPANLIHDGSEEVLKVFPKTDGAFAPVKSGHNGDSKGIYGDYAQRGDDGLTFYGDSGSAARFFYCAKADNYEREKGLEKGFEEKHVRRDDGQPYGMNTNKFRPDGSERKEVAARKNNHPTVKPIDLMRYLVKLITKKGGICIDPYCGSGTTLVGCKLELINYIGIEREAEYIKIAEARVKAWNPDKYITQTLF